MKRLSKLEVRVLIHALEISAQQYGREAQFAGAAPRLQKTLEEQREDAVRLAHEIRKAEFVNLE